MHTDHTWNYFKDEGLPTENGKYLVWSRINPNVFPCYEIFDFATNIKEKDLDGINSEEYNHPGFYSMDDDFD